MSADVCPKCRQQMVLGGSCGYCGWNDGSEDERELERLRTENESFREAQDEFRTYTGDGWSLDADAVILELVRLRKRVEELEADRE